MEKAEQECPIHLSLQEQTSTCRVLVIPVVPSKEKNGSPYICVTDTGISWRCPSLLWWATEAMFLMAEVRGIWPSASCCCLLCFVCAALSPALCPHTSARLRVVKGPCAGSSCASVLELLCMRCSRRAPSAGLGTTIQGAGRFFTLLFL